MMIPAGLQDPNKSLSSGTSKEIDPEILEKNQAIEIAKMR